MRMSEPGAYKCSCKNCDEHLEYPTGWEGTEIKCPHCGKDTLLEQAAEQLADAAKKAAEAAGIRTVQQFNNLVSQGYEVARLDNGDWIMLTSKTKIFKKP